MWLRVVVYIYAGYRVRWWRESDRVALLQAIGGFWAYDGIFIYRNRTLYNYMATLLFWDLTQKFIFTL